MQRGSTKTIGILFVIILVVLLIAHLVTLRNVRTEFAAKETTMTQQLEDTKQQVEDLTMQNRVLNAQLELESVRIEIVRNNFGTAREAAERFQAMLVDGGCKKLDELAPVFENLNTSLLKKNDTAALADLEQMYQIIFGAKAAEEAPETAEPESVQMPVI